VNSPTKIIGLIAVGVVFIIAVLFSGRLWETVDAGEIAVIQYTDGSLKAFTTPGFKPQSLGTVTKYKKRDNFDFLLPKGKGDSDRSLKIVFNDGGVARISGTTAYELPTDEPSILKLHAAYRSQEALERALIEPVISKSILAAGPMMSSTESYSSRRNELLSVIDDQVDNGVLKTKSTQTKAYDELTKTDKNILQIEIIRDAKGIALREDVSALKEFGIRTFNLAIKDIDYSAAVDTQIQQQQQMITAVQTSIMEARQAEQSAITAEKKGQASIATAKAEQEVIKTTAVTQAEKARDVARLDAESAALEKQAKILRGQGDAEARRLAMSADGALAQRLANKLAINEVWAKAWAENGAAVVPSIQMGGSSTPQTNWWNIVEANAALDLQAKTASKK